MSSASWNEDGAEAPMVWSTRSSAEESLGAWRKKDGARFGYEIRARPHGGFMIARLNKSGGFDSWVTR